MHFLVIAVPIYRLLFFSEGTQDKTKEAEAEEVKEAASALINLAKGL